jgi:hypothetical protein
MIRMVAPATPLHPESLLRIALVRQMLEDRRFRLQPRAIDRTWQYERAIPMSVVGFNPFNGTIYYGARSFLARWLREPHASARLHNEGDYLVRELLFAVHDYLHAWSVALIRELAPELGYGSTPIIREQIDRLAFCHLLTEAVATCGLDYWYLSTLELDDVVPIGSLTTGLTISYHERFLPEYRRFHPEFRVQDPEFFGNTSAPGLATWRRESFRSAERSWGRRSPATSPGTPSWRAKWRGDSGRR